jgi:hypothetical protein
MIEIIFHQIIINFMFIINLSSLTNLINITSKTIMWKCSPSAQIDEKTTFQPYTSMKDWPP